MSKVAMRFPVEDELCFFFPLHKACLTGARMMCDIGMDLR